MDKNKLFNNIEIDKIHINKELFKNYIKLYKIFNSEVKEVDTKLSKKMKKVLEDAFIMATKMNKKVVEYKVSHKKKEMDYKLKETIKESKKILKEFGDI